MNRTMSRLKNGGRRLRRMAAPLPGLIMTVLLVASFGCAQLEAPAPQRERKQGGWSQTKLRGVDYDTVFEAGLYAMRQWFRVEEISPSRGMIASAVTEMDQQGGTGRLRDAALNYRNRVRRMATLVIRQDEGDTVAKCQVRVQRLDTADHRVFRQNQQFSDLPNDTPIDRGAGVTSEQNEIWTDLPRDRQLERQILDVIRSRVSEAVAQGN